MRMDEKIKCVRCGQERTTNYIKYPDLCIFCIPDAELEDKLNKENTKEIMEALKVRII